MRELTYKASFSGSIGLKDAPTKATIKPAKGIFWPALLFLAPLLPAALDFVFNDPAGKARREAAEKAAAEKTRRMDMCEGFAAGMEAPLVAPYLYIASKDVGWSDLMQALPNLWPGAEQAWAHDKAKGYEEA